VTALTALMKVRRPRAATSGGISLLATLWLLSGCASGETLFRSDFDESVGTVPKGSNGAAVGTVASDPNSTNHVVVLPTSPPGGSVRIARQQDGDVPPPTSSFQCLFAQPAGDGTSVFSARLSIPGSVSGPISIQFEPANTPVTELGSSFLHLDLMPDNTIRIDDNDATKFGTFPRGDEFLLQVILKINAAPSANIAVGGPGASGGRDYQIQPQFVPLARQYGAVRLWLGAQTFTRSGVFVKDVLVRRRSP